MRWAQVMMRTLTIGTFLIYLVLFLGFRRLLVLQCTGVIWGVYLTLTAMAFVIGFRHLRRLGGWEFRIAAAILDLRLAKLGPSPLFYRLVYLWESLLIHHGDRTK